MGSINRSWCSLFFKKLIDKSYKTIPKTDTRYIKLRKQGSLSGAAIKYWHYYLLFHGESLGQDSRSCLTSIVLVDRSGLLNALHFILMLCNRRVSHKLCQQKVHKTVQCCQESNGCQHARNKRVIHHLTCYWIAPFFFHMIGWNMSHSYVFVC